MYLFLIISVQEEHSLPCKLCACVGNVRLEEGVGYMHRAGDEVCVEGRRVGCVEGRKVGCVWRGEDVVCVEGSGERWSVTGGVRCVIWWG